MNKNNRKYYQYEENRSLFRLLPLLILNIIIIFFFLSCSSGKLPKASQRMIPSEQPYSQREAVRRLPLDGADNFRDLGGYPTEDGRNVRWGFIYRSNHLHDLSKEDLRYLERLELQQIVDFRGLEEREDEADLIPNGASPVYRPINIAGTEIRDKVKATIKGEEDMDLTAYMMNSYREFATNYTEVYSDWIHSFLNEQDTLPQVFHCTAGKDRAGFASAILLSVLGVSRDHVMEDYLLTNEFSADSINKTIKLVKFLTFFKNDGEILRPLLSVDAAYLEVAFQTIDQEWGDFETYVRQGLKLTGSEVSALKDLFLE